MREFARLLFEASADALSGRNQLIFDARYGYLRGAESKSFEQVGQMFGITSIRVRQIMSKCLTRIRWKGVRQHRLGHHHTPCAKLVIFAMATVGESVTPHTVLDACNRLGAPNDWMLAYLLINITMPASEYKRLVLFQTKNIVAARTVEQLCPLPLLQASVTI